jgi:hypothetical protein
VGTRDAQDHDGDRQPDQRVGDGQADRHDGGARDHREAHVGVGAGVVAVGGQGGAAQRPTGAGADLGGKPVAGEADGAGGGEGAEVAWCARVHEPADRLHPRDARRDEDRADDEEAGDALGARGAKREGGGERDGRGRVAEVVDEVGQQRDAVGCDEDGGLGQRRASGRGRGS